MDRLTYTLVRNGLISSVSFDILSNFITKRLSVINYQLVTELYMDVKAKVNSLMSNVSRGQFSMDGWTGIKQSSIFNFIFNSPLPFFLQSFQLKTRKELLLSLKELIECVTLTKESFTVSQSGKEDSISQWPSIFSLITDKPNTLDRFFCSRMCFSCLLQSSS